MARIELDENSNNEDARAGVRRLTRSVEVADVLGLLMILVTGMSAYATWRTAELASQVLVITARPYLGTADVHFDRTNTEEPRVVADLRNFGTVQATDTAVDGYLLFNGNKVTGRHRGPTTVIDGGVFSPGVPHPVYFHLPADTYQAVQQAKGRLQLKIEMRYSGPGGDHHCYAKSFSYDRDDNEFYSDHGTLACK